MSELIYLYDPEDVMIESVDTLDEALRIAAKAPGGGTILIGDEHGPHETIARWWGKNIQPVNDKFNSMMTMEQPRAVSSWRDPDDIAAFLQKEYGLHWERDRETAVSGRKIRTSFMRVTWPDYDDDPEEEHGWKDEDGEDIDDDGGWGSIGIVQNAVRWLKNHGISPWDARDAEPPFEIYYQEEGDQDPISGANTRYDFHLDGFEPDELNRIHAELTGKEERGVQKLKRNPPTKTLEGVRREFRRLVADPDPAALDVAEDLLEENEMTLSQVSARTNPRYQDSLSGLFLLTPATRGEHVSVEWTITDIFDNGTFDHVIVVFAGSQSFTESFDVDTRENALASCMETCWTIVRRLREELHAGRDIKLQLRQLVEGAMHSYSRARKPIMNPARDVKDLEDAKAKFEEFHRKVPTKIGDFASSFEIPSSMKKLGKAKYVLYRSNKKNPETGRPVSKPVDYIHDHDAGVHCYVPGSGETVPKFIQNTDALVRLGHCLGFCYKDGAGEHEAKGTRPLPELYATPCGRALLIVQDKRELIAMVWGGGLGVEARGIVG